MVQLEVSEDASIGDMVGPGPIAATDPDEGDELTYSIEETAIEDPNTDHSEFFAIDRATGQITLKRMVDKETVDRCDRDCGTGDLCLVTVTATDSSGDPGWQTIACNSICKSKSSTSTNSRRSPATMLYPSTRIQTRI